MADVNAIVQSLRLLVKGRQSLSYLMMCTVVSVDGITCTCQPIDDGEAEIPDVRLVGEESDTNFILIPKVNSVVGVLAFCDLETTEYTVVLTSEVDTINLRGDQYDGLVRVSDLVTKLNNLENKVNALVNFTSTHTHTGVQTGGGSSGPTATPVTGTLTPTQQTDIENENVKHG